MAHARARRARPTPATPPKDPDRQTQVGGDPPTYDAIRADTFVYVHYVNGDASTTTSPATRTRLHNLGPTLSPRRIAQLDLIMTG